MALWQKVEGSYSWLGFLYVARFRLVMLLMEATYLSSIIYWNFERCIGIRVRAYLDLLEGHYFYFMPPPPISIAACRQPLLTHWSVVLYCFLISFCLYNRLFYSFDLKTESTRKLNNFDFQWTKTLCQNNLKHIAFFFYIFQGLKM